MQIECACVDRPKLERENDIFLMDAVCARSKEKLSDPKIRTINYYRNYLEVKRLSDICTADGHYNITSAFDGKRSVTQSQNRLEEIIQDRPGNKKWAEWRKLLRSFCHADSNQLINSLGKWTKQYIHHNDYGHFITPRRPTYYTMGIETIGMTTESTNSMNMNAMMQMFSILYLK